jgi:hypothetical protein
MSKLVKLIKKNKYNKSHVTHVNPPAGKSYLKVILSYNLPGEEIFLSFGVKLWTKFIKYM